jgi:tetratricopeptide (TPR) repeat protein
MKKEIILIITVLLSLVLMHFNIPGGALLSTIGVLFLSIYYIIAGLTQFNYFGLNKTSFKRQFKEVSKTNISLSILAGLMISSTILFIELIVLLRNGGLTGLKVSLFAIIIIIILAAYKAFIKKKSVFKKIFLRLFTVGCIGLVFHLVPYNLVINTFHPNLISELDQKNDKAIELFNKGENEEALSTLDNIISRFSPYLMAYNNKGYILHTMGRHDEALNYFNHVLEEMPNHMSALANRGYLCNDLNMYEAAEKDFSKVLNADSENKSIRYSRSISYYELEQIDSACSDFTIATKNNNNFSSNVYFDNLSKLCK